MSPLNKPVCTGEKFPKGVQIGKVPTVFRLCSDTLSRHLGQLRSIQDCAEVFRGRLGMPTPKPPTTPLLIYIRWASCGLNQVSPRCLPHSGLEAMGCMAKCWQRFSDLGQGWLILPGKRVQIQIQNAHFGLNQNHKRSRGHCTIPDPLYINQT